MSSGIGKLVKLYKQNKPSAKPNEKPDPKPEFNPLRQPESVYGVPPLKLPSKAAYDLKSRQEAPSKPVMFSQELPKKQPSASLFKIHTSFEHMADLRLYGK